MIRFEALAISIANLNGAFDSPDSKAFKLCNPGLLKTYRPEKKVDSENFRIFSSMMGGFKALVADLQVKCSGKNHKLTSENSLRDLLTMFDINNDIAGKKIMLFLRRALGDDVVTLDTKLNWFLEEKES